MATNLQGEDVVQEGKHDVSGGSRQGRARQPGPGDAPREVWLAALHLRRWEGGGELALHVFGGNVSKGGHGDLRQGENLQKESSQLLERRRDVLGMGTAAKGG
jgi:hypothetical protein